MLLVFKHYLILFLFALVLLGIPCFSSALPIQHEDGNVLPVGDSEMSLDVIDFSDLSESSLLKEESYGQTIEKKNKSLNSMSKKDNYFLDELKDEYELKQIRQELLKGEYGNVKNEKAESRVSTRNIPKEKVDFNIDSLGEDFDVEQTLEKVVDKVKNKADNLMFISEQPNKLSTNSVANSQYTEKKYLQDDDFDREAFNETFKWTIIYLIIGLISLKLLIKIFSAIGSGKKKHRRRSRN